MLFLAIAFMGIYAFSRLGVDLLPNVDLPKILIQTDYPGAAPSEVERLITEPVESTANTVPGVKKVSSITKEGVSFVTVSFEWGTDIDLRLLSLREKLDNLRFTLPEEAGRPVIIKHDPTAAPVMSLAIVKARKNSNQFHTEIITENSSAREIEELINLKEVANSLVRRRLEQIAGVSRASVVGGLNKELIVEIDSDRMSLYKLNYGNIIDELKASNINLSAGSIMSGQFRYSLRVLGEFTGVEDIRNTVIKRNKDGSFIRVSDIANVKNGFSERTGFTRLNGSETIGILVYKEPGSNTVNVSEEVKKVISSLNNENKQFDLFVVTDTSEFVENAISNVEQEIVYGGILAVFVLFFFLGKIKNIVIIGITIPASLLLTMLLMYLTGINFNIISLGGIAVGIGMLLDNSIVVIENIITKLEKVERLKSAVFRGAQEVAMPVFAATLTTAVVFLPLIFLEGVAGAIFREQSLAIVYSLFSSVFVALTLIPMLASREYKFSSSNSVLSNQIILPAVPSNIFAKVKYWIKFPFLFLIRGTIHFLKVLVQFGIKITKSFENYFFAFSNRLIDSTITVYEKLLIRSLNNKSFVLLISLILVIITIFCVIEMKKEFIPEGASDDFIVEITYSKNTSLTGNAEVTAAIEKKLLSLVDIENIVSYIGRTQEHNYRALSETAENKSKLLIKLNNSENYFDVKKKISLFLQSINGITFKIKQTETAYSSLIGSQEDDLSLEFRLNSQQNIDSIQVLLLQELSSAGIDNVEYLRIANAAGAPEYVVGIDLEKCLRIGVKPQLIGDELLARIKGNDQIKFSEFDKKIAIRIQSGSKFAKDFNKILQENISINGNLFPINEFVEYDLKTGTGEIIREDQNRILRFYGRSFNGEFQKAEVAISSFINGNTILNNYNYKVGGLNEEIENSFGGLYAALLISFILMYMVLASEFESFLFPFIIIFSVPLGLIGGIISLYLLGESLSIISLTGLVILIGIADNDAVVKVEFIIRKIKEGLPVRNAIIAAGRDRFRPIVMNSFTVILGLFPMMIGLGAATQLRISLAIAIAGGLLSATILTLIIIPVLFEYLEKYSRKNYK
ncbi:MAG: efflux RND transporter permease subunit [Melioribacteraceae bacterium]|nr:efflux RND transporter permease subunit [Melioribacteraceae bacterium]